LKPILEVRNLSKQFKIGAKQEPYLSIRDLISNSFNKSKRSDKLFLALDDVSFKVNPGESIGIIGKNGAGKSTLLKILSKITPPTSGKIISRGRIASLLEVGTGFHPELSGRENIFMNGSILGMRRNEINKHFDAIVNFSGVEKFIDTPLKRYSSGMQLRLAFAVAAHLEPEILIIDEVLAVGDAEFQKKCLGKMNEVSKSGRTVLFVSHDMNAIEQLCSKVIVLQKGQLVASGDTHQLISNYLNENKEYNVSELWLSEHVKMVELVFQSQEIVSGERMQFSLTLEYAENQIPVVNDFCLLIYSLKGLRVAIIDLRPYLSQLEQDGNRLSLKVTLEKFNLVDGEYSIGLYYVLNNIRKEILDISQIRVKPSPVRDAKVSPYLPQYRGYVELKDNIKIG
jgi:lipopolysaccharide transport system ATP-binding protein